MLYNSEGGSAKTNLCARNAPLLLDINFLGVKDELGFYLRFEFFTETQKFPLRLSWRRQPEAGLNLEP
jgi:hypothetical protein